MKKRLKITIGIPVYNEEANILSVLNDILKQKEEGFTVKEILVISDGSTDRTPDLIEALDEGKITLIREKSRLGKPVRVNQLFSMVNSDLILILDGDITLADENVVSNLVKPFLSNRSTRLVSGVATPHLPKTFVEKIFYVGAQIWESAKYSVKDNEMYLCEGRIRAFSKKLYKEIKFPLTSAEDVYPFLYCKTKNYKFTLATKSKVYYYLPKTINDYTKQIKRFWNSEKIQAVNFSRDLTDKYYSIRLKDKLNFAFKYFFKKPFFTSAYVVFLIVPKLLFFLNPGESGGVWEIAQSTKGKN